MDHISSSLALAAWLADQGDLHAALLLLRDVEAAGHEEEAIRARCRILMRSGRYQEAATEWARLLAKQSVDEEATRELAIARRLANNRALAWIAAPRRLVLASAAIVLIGAAIVAIIWPLGAVVPDFDRDAINRLEAGETEMVGQVNQLRTDVLSKQTESRALIVSIIEQQNQIVAMMNELTTSQSLLRRQIIDLARADDQRTVTLNGMLDTVANLDKQAHADSTTLQQMATRIDEVIRDNHRQDRVLDGLRVSAADLSTRLQANTADLASTQSHMTEQIVAIDRSNKHLGEVLNGLKGTTAEADKRTRRALSGLTSMVSHLEGRVTGLQPVGNGRANLMADPLRDAAQPAVAGPSAGTVQKSGQ